MRKIILLISCFVFVVIYYTFNESIHNHTQGHEHPVEAHSGRTDRYGGHNNRKTGGYHYHHGCSAHQHPNGKCKYKFRSCK